ncbi:MAG: cytochrome c [Candidatus Acidiferrum sp.]
MYQLSATVAFALFAVAVAFPQAQPRESELAVNPVYKEHCAKCHGKTAEGRHFGGPSLISEKVASASTEDLRNIITDGKGRMPKFASKLTPDQIDALVHQIQTLNKK